MNFYTLTFKKKILISFILIFVGLVVIDIGLYFVAKMKSTKTTFINDKFSKIIHMNLNNPINKDIIFVGSSRTFYHIDTNIFKNKEIDIYNFGISGAQFEDYPTIIPYINKVKPKKIIIGLSVYRLYDKLNISKYPTLEEIKYYYNIDKIKFLEALKQWIINRHLFLQYSEPIYYKLKSIYEKFNSHTNSIINVISNTKDNIKDENKIFIDSFINYSKLVGCKVFDIKQTGDYQITLKCTNGDGILIGNHIDYKKVSKTKIFLKDFNKDSIKYINQIINNFDKNIQVVLILEPILHNPYQYDIKKIKKQFKGTKIIDLTNYKIQDNFWSDNSHVNYKGKKQYSEHLIKLVKSMKGGKEK